MYTPLYCTAIESSTLHGRHTCGSRTVMSLLMKTRQGLEGIRDSSGNVLSRKKNIHTQEYSGDFENSNLSMQEHSKVQEKEKEILKTKINLHSFET